MRQLLWGDDIAEELREVRVCGECDSRPQEGKSVGEDERTSTPDVHVEEFMPRLEL